MVAELAGVSITAGVIEFAFNGEIESFYVRNPSAEDRRYGAADA